MSYAVACCLNFLLCCFVVLVFVVCYSWFVVGCWLLLGCGSLFVVVCVLCAVCGVFVVRCSLRAVGWLFFGVVLVLGVLVLGVWCLVFGERSAFCVFVVCCCGCCLLFDVCFVVFFVSCWRYGVRCLLLVVCCMLCVCRVRGLLLLASCVVFVVCDDRCCSLFVVRCGLFVVVCLVRLLRVVCGCSLRVVCCVLWCPLFVACCLLSVV